MNYEKSGGYITIPDEHVIFTKKDRKDVYDENGDEIIEENEEENEEELDEGVKMVRDLQSMKTALNQKLDEDDDVELLDGVELDGETRKTGNSLEFSNDEKKMLDFKDKAKEIVNLKFKTKDLTSIASAVESSQSVMATDL